MPVFAFSVSLISPDSFMSEWVMFAEAEESVSYRWTSSTIMDMFLTTSNLSWSLSTEFIDLRLFKSLLFIFKGLFEGDASDYMRGFGSTSFERPFLGS